MSDYHHHHHAHGPRAAPLDGLGLSARGLGLVRQARTEAPVRTVRPGRRHVCVRLPSRKMQAVVVCESRHIEYPFACHCEHDPDVLEYRAQPFWLSLTYVSGRRRVRVGYVPDFLVIRRTVADVIECKTERELARLLREKPERWSRDDDGQPTSPPVLAALAGTGLGYRVVTPRDLDPTALRNALILGRYLDDGDRP